MASELVPVEQVDRNAAIRLLEAGDQDWQAKEVRLGNGDHFPLVQAFARHRLAALESQASRIAELEAGLRAISTFKCDDPAGAFYTVRLRARVLLGDREGG